MKPLKIALISPKGPLYRHKGGIWTKSLRYMPLTLPTLKALVPADLNATVECYDEGIVDVPQQLDADLIGMTVITGTAKRAYELSAHFRAQGKKVVLGGPHVTLIPEDAVPHADAIVCGYAEDEWPRLLRDHVAGNLQPRYTQKEGLDIGGRPLPDRSVLPKWKYLTANVFEATRGCKHNCSFCVVPTAWGRTQFQKPPEEIVEDITRMGARQALFLDLNIISDTAYATRLFEALLPLKIQWYGLSTTLLCDDMKLLSLASRSGCRGLLMGLESVSKASLRSNSKQFNDPAKYHQVVERLHAHNIALQGCFVFGLDEDDSSVFERTAQFALDAKIDLPRFAVVTPFPGTPLFKQFESEGRLLHKDWQYYDAQHVVFQPAHMSIDELQLGTERAWKMCYSWSGMWNRLKHTAAPLMTAITTNLGYRYYAHRLNRFYTCDFMINPDEKIGPPLVRKLPVVQSLPPPPPPSSDTGSPGGCGTRAAGSAP